MEIHPLRAFRKRQKPPLSQDDLAKVFGVSRVTVTRWESGARLMDPDYLQVVAERTGIPPAKLRPDLAQVLKRPD